MIVNGKVISQGDMLWMLKKEDSHFVLSAIIDIMLKDFDIVKQKLEFDEIDKETNFETFYYKFNINRKLTNKYHYYTSNTIHVIQ